jgi:hypothetical protein
MKLYKGIYTEELIDEQWQYQDKMIRLLLGWTMDIIWDTHTWYGPLSKLGLRVAPAAPLLRPWLGWRGAGEKGADCRGNEGWSFQLLFGTCVGDMENSTAGSHTCWHACKPGSYMYSMFNMDYVHLALASLLLIQWYIPTIMQQHQCIKFSIHIQKVTVCFQ